MDENNPGTTVLDVFDFVDSRSVRAYWRSIGWTPNAVEASFIIASSRKRTIAEKHTAWKRLIESTPDANFPSRMHHLKGASLHAFLKHYMTREAQILDELRSDDDGENGCCWLVSKPHSCHEDDWFVCPSFDYAIDRLACCIEEGDWDLCASRFLVSKRYFDTNGAVECDERIVSALFSPGLEPLRVIDGQSPFISLNEQDVLWLDFDAMWFNFPLPFKRGDIVSSTSLFGGERRFVLASNATLDPSNEHDAKVLERRTRYGDASDMTVLAHSVSREDGFITFHQHEHDLLNMDYYTDELEGYEKELEVLSRFTKGEINIRQCLLERREIQFCQVKALEREQLDEARFIYGDDVPESLDSMAKGRV